MHKESRIRDPLIDGNKTFHDITVEVAYPVEGKANKYWWTLFGLSVILMLWGFGCIAYTIGTEELLRSVACVSKKYKH